VDTWSRQATYESTLELIATAGVIAYAIQYDTRNSGGSPTSPLDLPRLPGAPLLALHSGEYSNAKSARARPLFNCL
jgi:hypothetical protein